MSNDKLNNKSSSFFNKKHIFRGLVFICFSWLLFTFLGKFILKTSLVRSNNHFLNNINDLSKIELLQTLDIDEIDSLSNLLQDIRLIKRDSSYVEIRDEKENHTSSESSSSLKPIDEPGIRFLIVLSVFIFLNMLAICIHHIYMKISNSSASYRTVEQNMSPF